MNAAYRKNFAAIDWKPLPPLPRSHQPVARGDFPTPMVASDSMDQIQSMTNGQYYDSKAALRTEYRRAGVVEVGNEVQKHQDAPRPTKDDGSIDRALSAAGL